MIVQRNLITKKMTIKHVAKSKAVKSSSTDEEIEMCVNFNNYDFQKNNLSVTRNIVEINGINMFVGGAIIK